jgi:hypothetical protein
MYSRREASELKQEFWTKFGQYMLPVPSAEGVKINWVNYKTGEKGIFFKMQANNKSALIAIELNHPDIDIQQLIYEQFLQMKTLLHTVLGEEWIWQQQVYNENAKIISRIYKELTETSIYKKEDWPKLIEFFKKRIMALDEFWSSGKYAFEALR